MKISKIHRLLKLITLLQTGKCYQAEDLARELKVSRRTLFRDLQLAKRAGIPLSFDPTARRYFVDEKFFLPPINFTPEEATGLMMLGYKAVPHNALPNYKAIESAITKIDATFSAELQKKYAKALEKIEFRCCPVSDVGRAKQTFDLLWNAAQDQKVVKISYESEQGKHEFQTQINPCQLIFISRAWYVIGYCRRHKKVRSFKVERITNAMPTGSTFRPDHQYDPATYFGKAWKMRRGNTCYNIKIRFSAQVADNVEEVHWHSTQQTRHFDDGSMLYEAEVEGLDEIVWWILGYGMEAVVEAPAELRQMLREHAQAMATHYKHS